VDKAIAHLQSHAKPKPTPPWQCAKYTRQAIEAGGLVLVQHLNAKDYGTSLLQAGFLEVPGGQTAAWGFVKGDVVVFTSGSTKESAPGHMQMYDGTKWISDHVQKHFIPGSIFRDSSYKVYRHGTFWEAQPTPGAAATQLV
jgi:hypothetical protein